MTDDIVHRLRYWVHMMQDECNPVTLGYELVDEAADRIEALEDEHKRTRPLVVAMMKRIEALDAALREIANELQWDWPSDRAIRALEGKT